MNAIKPVGFNAEGSNNDICFKYEIVMTSPTAKARETYHHGELPDVLMSLALTHISEHGTEKLSLRALAREAGVSQTAPYRHFPTKKCLLAALATRGFNNLREYIREALDGQEDVQQRFIAMGCAYVQFAIDNPMAYQLMFGSVLGDFSEYDMLHEASGDCYGQVLEVLQELIDANSLDEDLAHLGGVVWSGVHGMASLLLNQHAKMSQGKSAKGEARSAPMKSLTFMGRDLSKSLHTMFGHLLR